MGRTIGLAAFFIAALAWAGERFTKEQLDARFYYDLGPGEVDVSSYPKEQQSNYARFKETCSQCHTLARPINAPITERKDWKRYVERMHLHSRERKDTVMTKEGAKAIVDFLAFDSAERKVKQKEAFQKKSEELKALFKEAQEERLRIKAREDEQKTRTPPPYTGTK